MSSIIINIDTALTDVPIIEIGKQGENEATQVVFDVSDLIDTFGSGTAYVVVQRRGDAEPYLLDNTQQSSDKVTWTVSNVDTDVYGMGRVQLFWMIDDQVAKSVNYQFYVEEALGNPADAPVVPGGWISEKIGDLDELTTTAKENLVAAINEVNALVNDMADDVEGLTGDVETLQTQMETKANVDGLYEDMTVGNAEQLIASDYVTDKVPYLFRKTGGSTDVGNREYDTLVGASAVWNQLLQDENFSQTSNWRPLSSSTVSIANNECTISITSNFGGIQNYGYDIPVISDHKYLVLAEIKADSQRSTVGFGLSDSSSQYQVRKIFTVGTSYSTYAFVGQETTGTIDGGRFMLYDTSGSDGVTLNVKNVNAIDLTTLFGSSTIPDYVYSLEQSTSGSGVAWLRQYFPKLFEYHEYDAGTLKSVEGVESHDMVGFNQWDESTAESNYIYSKAGVKTAGNNLSCGMIRVLPSTSYYLKAPHCESVWNAVFFDAEKNGLNDAIQVTSGQSGKLFTTPSNCHYVGLNMQTADKGDICLNLSNSGYRNGEYEPYWKRSYPLDSTWVGRGIYKLGSDGKPYADGDTYASDGSGEVRYGVVDLGTLDWSYNSNGRYISFDIMALTRKYPTNVIPNIVGEKFRAISWGSGLANNHDGITLSDTGAIYTYAESDSSPTPTGYLIYELATPTSAEYEPFQSPQICDDFGTEEYVTDCLIPVGHETKYPANLRDKIQHLPDLSNLGNGSYIINQTGTQMSLIPITSIIPAVPTTNGTYKLKCTVSGGQATLTWEVDS